MSDDESPGPMTIQWLQNHFAEISKQGFGPSETLEDRFAMAALTGLLLREDTRGWAWDSFGAHAFQIARACMAERSKK